MKTSIRILYLEDNLYDAEITRNFLEEAGFSCDFLITDSQENYIRALEKGCIDLILSDFTLPSYNGKLALEAAKKIRPDIPFIFVSGTIGEDAAIESLTQGATDYVLKTKLERLVPAVRRALEESEEHRKRKESESKLEESYRQLQQIFDGIMRALELTIETRDPYTAGHQRRTSHLARAIAEEMKLGEHVVQGTFFAGLIHDLGKIYVPAEILNKPCLLNETELRFIKTHPQIGFDILKSIRFPWPVAEITLQHHEKLDGSGYPKGISKEKILIESRIICVADVVEAMISHRPYRPARSLDMAIRELLQNQGVHYDKEVVKICISLLTEKKFQFPEET